MQRTARTEQSKPVARAVRKPPAMVCFLGSNTTDHTITLSIRGVAYEYFLTPLQCETVYQLCRKGLGRRALVYAKSRAWSVLKCSQTSATCT
jgi:hypothetical protein